MVILSPLTAAMGSSCDACGWAGAFMSMLGFGSFGAPIKSVSQRVDFGFGFVCISLFNELYPVMTSPVANRYCVCISIS